MNTKYLDAGDRAGPAAVQSTPSGGLGAKLMKLFRAANGAGAKGAPE
jgi:hypothetical protein